MGAAPKATTIDAIMASQGSEVGKVYVHSLNQNDPFKDMHSKSRAGQHPYL